MHPDQRLRKAVKGFYAYIGSVLAAGAGPIVGMRLIHHESPALRAAGVVIGAGGWMPLLLLTVVLIRSGDEYAQRIHFLAASLAFAGGLVLIAFIDWLARGHFIEPLPYMVLWYALVGVWVIALVVATRHVKQGSAARGARS